MYARNIPARSRGTALLLALLAAFAAPLTFKAWATQPDAGKDVRVREVVLPAGDGEVPPLKLWVYLPADATGDKPLAAIFIAPAGSTTFTGMPLAEGDRPEHLPYVEAGMAVIAYELPGDATTATTDADYARAYQAFSADDAGVRSGRRAIDWALQNLPNLDRDRLYAAGHSSAANVALLLAAADDRLDAVAAFAPEPDRLNAGDLTPQDWADAEGVLPGIRAFLRRTSPLARAAEIDIPTLLFVARDDEFIPVDAVRKLAEAVRNDGTTVELIEVAEGGHYDAMIEQGIPRAVDWFTSRPATTQAAAPASDD